MKTNFNQNGIQVVNNLLSHKDKNIIREVIVSNFENYIDFDTSCKNFENLKFHKKIIEFRKKNQKKFGEIYDNINLNARFRSIFYQNKFLKTFSKLLNTSKNKIYINGFMMRFDTPFDNKNTLGWHQDTWYYKMSKPNNKSAVCWTAITKNTSKNGTLIYVPNSHSKFLKSTDLKKKDRYITQTRKIEITKKELSNKKNLNLGSGSASFFHLNLKHKSGINYSKKIRLTVGCTFHDMGENFNSGKEFYRISKNSI